MTVRSGGRHRNTRSRQPWPAGLPPSSLPLLDRLAAAARAADVEILLVGGTVRDLLLGRPPRDVDVLVLGDGVRLARAAARGTSLQALTHPRFGTARLADPVTGGAVDLASARGETYLRPGALPAVRPGSLAEDLARRDFTINAMALRVHEVRAARLVDGHGGRRDLKRRLVRILHPRSFVDDPSRAFRAARLAARLGFRLEPRTAARLREAVAAGAVQDLSPARIGAELAHLAREPDVAACLDRLGRRGLLRAIHPGLAPPRAPGARRRLSRLLQAAPEGDRLLALVAFLLMDAAPGQVEGALGRVELPAGGRRRMPAILARARGLAGAGGGPTRLPAAAEEVTRLVAQACHPAVGKV